MHYAPPLTRTHNGIVYEQPSQTVCGACITSARKTEDPSKTSCRSCLKTKAWRKAWKKLEEA